MVSSFKKTQLRRARIVRFTVFFGFLALTGMILFAVKNLLLATVLAFVISYLLAPLVNSLERAGMDRLYSVILTYAILGFIFTMGIGRVSPFIGQQVSSFRHEIPNYRQGTIKLIVDWENKLAELTGSSISLSQKVNNLMLEWTTSLFDDLPAFLSSSLTTILLAPFFAFFLLKDGRQLSKKVLALVPNSIFELVLDLHHQINDQTAQFVRARLLEAGIVGLVVWAGLAAFSFPYAFLLASFAALMNLVPYLGPFIGAAPAIIIALINGNMDFGLAIVIGVYSAAQLLDIFFIIPLVVAKLVDLHPVTVVVVIIIGAQLLGVLGMLISIPVTSTLKVTFTALYNHLTQFRA